MLNPTFKPYKNTITAASAAPPKRRKHHLTACFPEGPECDAKVCLTRPSNPLKTLGPEPRLVCLTQPSNPIKTLLPQPRQRFRNGVTPSNGVFPEGPECDAKVCLTRPSNPLKTLGPVPWLVCLTHATFKPYKKHYYRSLGSASETAKHHLMACFRKVPNATPGCA